MSSKVLLLETFFIDNHQKAVEDYSKAIESAPKGYLNYIYRANCYKKLKQYNLAKKDYKKALELTYNKGMQSFKDGDFKYVIEYLKVAAKLDPDDKEIAQEFNFQPHEQLDIEAKIAFPLKQGAKLGRRIDF